MSTHTAMTTENRDQIEEQSEPKSAGESGRGAVLGVTPCSAWPRPWRDWRGRPYQKIEYDVMLRDGTIIRNCWPNAGKLNAADGTGRSWNAGVKYRRAEMPNMDDIPMPFRNLQPLPSDEQIEAARRELSEWFSLPNAPEHTTRENL